MLKAKQAIDTEFHYMNYRDYYIPEQAAALHSNLNEENLC